MQLGKLASAVLVSGFLAGGLFLSGCDDKDVEIMRDPDVRIAKGMTWAWRPVNAPEDGSPSGGNRKVISRDVIGPQAQQQEPPQRLESNRDWNTEANRDTLKAAIAKNLQSKGLTQVTDPDNADFWVDYHLAVKTQTATVQRVYPGGYPGVACGPYGCWSGWGWGPPEVAFQKVRYREGTFVIDLALREPRKLAYRAISQKELGNKHTAISSSQADEAVSHLLKGLKTK